MMEGEKNRTCNVWSCAFENTKHVLPWCKGGLCRWCPTDEHIALLCGVHKTPGCGGWPLACLRRPKPSLSRYLNALYLPMTKAAPQPPTGWWRHLGQWKTKNILMRDKDIFLARENTLELQLTIMFHAHVICWLFNWIINCLVPKMSNFNYDFQKPKVIHSMFSYSTDES